MEAGGKINYPTNMAPRGDTVDEYPSADGTTIKVSDPYRFLEDPDSDATKAWVKAENEITEAFLGTCDLQGKLKDKLTQYWNYPKMGIPTKRGEHYYFMHNSGLQNQHVQYKIKEKNTFRLSKENPLSEAVVLLDANALSADGTASLSTKAWSKNGRYMAYQINRGGSDWATAYIRDAETLEILPNEELHWLKFSGMSWTHDNVGFFYSRFDAPLEKKDEKMDAKAGTETVKLVFQKVYYHRVGTA